MPRDVVGILLESVRTFISNFGLVALVGSTVAVPSSVLFNYLDYFAVDPDDLSLALGGPVLVNVVFSPLFVGAVLHGVSMRHDGNASGYVDAMSAGARSWGSLFVARLLAGLLIVLGMVALILPGLYLLVRYALIDCVVVFEDAAPSRALERSGELTKGRRVRIAVASLTATLVLLVPMIGVYGGWAVIEDVWAPPIAVGFTVSVIAESILDILFFVLTILMFLFYRQALEEGERLNEVDTAGAPTFRTF